MNLVGKIFVVLIFVLSLVLMSMTMMVYVTHTNWRQVVVNQDPKFEKGLKYQVEDLEEENRRLREQYTTVEDTLEKERAEKRKAVASLQTELTRQTDELAGLQKQVDDLQLQQLKNVTVAEAAQKQANTLTNENAGIRKQVASLNTERDAEIKKNGILNDQINNAERRMRDLQKRSEALSNELAMAKRVLAYYNLPPDIAYAEAKTPPVGLVARVTDVNNDRSLVEISVGSDDGVREGHQWDVQDAAGANFIGRIIVTRVEPHRSVCTAMTGMNNGVIAKNQRAVPVKAELVR